MAFFKCDSGDQQRRKVRRCVVVEKDNNPVSGGRNRRVVDRRHGQSGAVSGIDREWHKWLLRKAAANFSDHPQNLAIHAAKSRKIQRIINELYLSLLKILSPYNALAAGPAAAGRRRILVIGGP